MSKLRNAGRKNKPDDADVFGYNMRLSELLAAMGRDQLKLLDVKYMGDLNVFLHELRSAALSFLDTPKQLLSAGCSGAYPARAGSAGNIQ